MKCFSVVRGCMKKERFLKINRDNIISVGFFLVLSLFLVLCLILPDREFSDMENRKLAVFPETGIKAFAEGRFTKDFEQYSSDSVAGRDSWVKIKNTVDRLLGKQDNGQAYWGKNGYLFPIETVDLDRFESNLGYIEEFAGKAKTEHGIKNFYVMPVPTSQEILKNYLPKNAERANQAEVIRKTSERFCKDEGPVFIDAGSILEKHSDEYIYYRTDHHWTTLGAYYGYRAWAEIAGIEPLMREDFDESIVTDDFYGTTYSKISGFGISPDYIVKMSNSCIESNETEFRNASGQTEGKGGLFDEKSLKAKDKYLYFLGGNHPVVKAGHYKNEEERSGNEKKLLIIKDSYANCFIPFMTLHYDEVYAADLRYYKKSLLKLIDEEKIDDILVLYNAVQFANDPNFVFLKAE